MMTRKIPLLSAILVSGLLVCGPVMAADPTPSQDDLIPPQTASSTMTTEQDLDGETHPPLRLTPDKSELVPLAREAASVVIGNPAHITVLLDSPKLAVVIPRSNGATYFTVLDREGKVIMQRHVVVGSPKKNYVRVRRSCSAVPSGTPCQPTSVYFCPDMCHEVGAAGADGGNSMSAPTISAE